MTSEPPTRRDPSPGRPAPTGAHGDPSPGLSGDQRRLNALINALPALVAHWDTDLRNTMANDSYIEYFGITPAQMHGRHLREVVGETLYAANRHRLEAALAGQTQHFDQTIVDAGGVARHAQTSYLPDVVDGEVRGCFVLVSDVTQRRAAEIALADEMYRVRTILDAVTDAVISLDTALRVTEMNSAAIVMTGWQLAEAVRQPIDDLVTLVDRSDTIPVGQMCRSVLATGRSVHRTATDSLSGRDGVSVPIDWMITALTTAGMERRGVVLTLRDAGDARRLLADSQHRAMHDHLTGFKNRNYLDHLVERRRADIALPTAVVFLDLDGFKAVNDDAGHIAGDEVLRQVAQTIIDSVRGSDDVVRMGGDEFAVLLRECTLQDARGVAEKIVERVEKGTFRWRDSTFQLGVSAGVALADGESLTALDHAMERADKACYSAKRSGGHRVVVETPISEIPLQQRLSDG